MRAEFDLGESARVYAQGLYADYSVSHAARADSPVRHVPAGDQSVHPGRPQAAARLATGSSRGHGFLRSACPSWDRVSRENQYDVYQATSACRATIFDGWQYDAYVQVGANDQTDHQTGNVLTSRSRS